MEIGILNILDKKDISAERIVLQVREDCNSWAFIIQKRQREKTKNIQWKNKSYFILERR